MVGAALVQRLAQEQCEILTVDRRNVDLRRQKETEDWFAKTRPHFVFLAAAKVGGIVVNQALPGEFIYDNLMIATNVIEAARRGRWRSSFPRDELHLSQARAAAHA